MMPLLDDATGWQSETELRKPLPLGFPVQVIQVPNICAVYQTWVYRLPVCRWWEQVPRALSMDLHCSCIA